MYVFNYSREAGCSIWVKYSYYLSIHIHITLVFFYSIIQRLELATYRIELQAAIWASDQICEKSSRFAAVIFPKIDKKLRGKKSDIYTK